jgi:predicted MFS family arabinose efflux permease
VSSPSALKKTEPGIWAKPGFRAYINSTAYSGMAFAMQQLLISWLLIGVLHLAADNVGLLQALMGLPGIFIMLWGGASADRADPKALLIRCYALAPILPLLLIAANFTWGISIWSVALWGLGMSVLMSFTQPAQQAILNRVAGSRIQQAVSAATAAGFVVQITGLLLAGQMETIGLTMVLSIQGICFALCALAVRKIESAPINPNPTTESPLKTVVAGLKTIYAHKVIYHVLSINFISSIFNAGAFVTVFPFIIKRIYDGDALLLGTMMAIFFAGATVSNLLMYKIMPLVRPGRLFLLMQLTRMVILYFFWIEPGWWLLVAATIGWGLNMGFTTTLARTIVQESAAPEFRGRIMSVFTLGMMGSAPIGAIVLGNIIEIFGTLNALLPAMLVSVLLCGFGIVFTGVWQYVSPVAESEHQGES